jgi:hypothetical protein
MFSGTSKISLTLGPINGHFLAPWPRIYGFYYTKIPQKYLKVYGIILEKYYFYIAGNQKNENVQIMCVPNFSNLWIFEFEFLDFWNFEILESWICFYIQMIIYWKLNLWRWGTEHDTFSIIKQHPNLDLNFISCKKHELEITLNFVFSKNVP